MGDLFQIINSLFNIDCDITDAISKKLQDSSHTKGTYLLKPDQVSNKIMFIKEGLVRGYYLKNGKDITTGFMREGDFALSPVSFFWSLPVF
jgi:CRP/FNR family transcriptional regulator, anaerobic regulatory protein